MGATGLDGPAVQGRQMRTHRPRAAAWARLGPFGPPHLHTEPRLSQRAASGRLQSASAQNATSYPVGLKPDGDGGEQWSGRGGGSVSAAAVLTQIARPLSA